MLGLLVKDIRLMAQKKILLLIVLIISVVFNEDIEFLVGYTTFMAGILALGTLSNDEMDNGLEFIMTLPVDSKMYVTGKYLLCVLTSLVGWVVGFVVGTVANLANGGEGLAQVHALTISTTTIVLFTLIAVMIPVQLKFGIDKMRLVLAIIAGGTAAVIFLCKNIISEQVMNNMDTFFEYAYKHSGVFVGGVIALTVLILLISYALSLHIMKNKE